VKFATNTTTSSSPNAAKASFAPPAQNDKIGKSTVSAGDPSRKASKITQNIPNCSLSSSGSKRGKIKNAIDVTDNAT
jgi:hypothetical protein